MRITGDATLAAPVDQVWAALLDPAVLVRTIPGCERLETTGPDRYALVVSAGVASIRGTYSGSCSLSDLRPHESLRLSVNGSGSSGTVAADVAVRLSDRGDGTTGLSYDADATVGGMLGGVGQRLLGSVSKRMAGEFFLNVESAIIGAEAAVPGEPAEGAVAGAAGPQARPGGVYVAPPRAAAAPTELRSFLTGVAVGAGLVSLGGVLGWLAGRRR
ncbi:MAG: carbon monoxide dehydrogenase subunit G [Nocardioidaceae bacterium]|nr:carbon monoxide dehydrogenase subunit G [Nocardioidaceae bacterium]